MKYLLIFLVFLACNKSDKPTAYIRQTTDTVFTSANVAMDIVQGEYRTVTAMKIRFDNSRINPAILLL